MLLQTKKIFESRLCHLIWTNIGVKTGYDKHEGTFKRVNTAEHS